MPLGQGTPVREKSPEVNGANGAESVSESRGEDNESFVTVTNKNVEKKKKKREEKEKKRKEEEAKLEKKKKDCEFILNGICWHGFKGNIPKGDKKECPFNYLLLCKYFINYGKCKYREDCKGKHPSKCS